MAKRAKLSQMRLQPAGTPVTHISEEAFIEAATTMNAQVKLLTPKAEEKVTIDHLMKGMVIDAVAHLAELPKKVNEIHESTV